MEREPANLRDERGKIRDGVFKREDEGAVVSGSNTDGGEVGELAGGEGLGVFQAVELVAIFGAEGRGEDALIREDEIAGGHRVAVGPARVGAEVKGPRETIGGDRPFFGDAGDGTAIDGVDIREALQHGADNIYVRRVGGGLGIKIAGLGLAVEVEGLRAVARFDQRLALGAGGGEEKKEVGEGGSEVTNDGSRRTAKHGGGVAGTTPDRVAGGKGEVAEELRR
jgi:hypothetical protein